MKISYLSFLLIILFLTAACTDHHSSSPEFLNPTTFRDSIQIKGLFQKTLGYIEKSHFDRAKSEAFKLKNFSLKTKNIYYSGKAHSILGYLNLIENKEDSAYHYYNISKDYFLEIQDSLNLSKVLGNMAMIQSGKGDYSGSEITAIDALKYLGNTETASFQSSIYNCLAISSKKRNDYREAVYWYEKAINYATDSLNQNIYTNNLAVSYTYLEKYHKSEDLLSHLLQDSVVMKNPDLKSKIIDNLAYTKWKQDSTRNLENEFIEALKIRQENNDEWGQIASHSHLSEYFEKKNSASSLFHARKLYTIATKLNSPDDRLEALQKLISLASPENSKKYAILYTNLSDSLVTARNLAKDQFAKIRYDSEKNREENQLLQAETAEQRLEIERRKLVGFISLSTIILISGGAFAFFRIQKIKNQKRINDEIHLTESKIAGKIHDNLANNIYRIMSDVENTPDFHLPNKKNEFLNNLDLVYKLARDISRENSPVETGEDFADEMLSLISSYKNKKTNIVLMGFSAIKWQLLDNEKQIQFYKVLQELLTNMKKHSEATLVVLSFQTEKNNLHFFYTDNGVGIPVNQLNTKNGLRITENRIEKLKGTVSFVCEPQKGLKVNITMPL